VSSQESRADRPAGGFPERVTTARLQLRRWREGDLEAYEAIWADPGVAAALRPGRPLDPATEAAASLERKLVHWERHGFGPWAAITREGDEIVGWIGAWHPSFVPELATEIEIAWTLRGEFWGWGLATEGALAAVEAASAHLDPPRLISLIHPANHNSIGVAGRLGMRAAGSVVHPDLDEELLVYERRLPR
jgi:RimJ/RimL family protein N-acetyltransferase